MGEICEVLLPIPEEIIFGNNKSSIAICTLSSISLLKELSNSHLLKKVNVIGRLFSENKGIDTLINFVNSNPNIRTIIICGKDVWGHKSGETLLALSQHGIDSTGRIISSKSPEPILEVSKKSVEHFREHVTLVNKIGETDPNVIRNLVDSIINQ